MTSSVTHGSLHGVADLRPGATVDHLARQMQQQIDQPRRLIAAEQILQQLVLLRTDAGQAGHGGKQRVEQAGAHQANLGPFSLVMPGFMPGIHVFFRAPAGQRAMTNRGLTGPARVAISPRPGTSGLLAFDWI
ncbi:hypothetical protein ACVWZK_005532 [Bradyrhizobium sp. GM0.4]